MGWLLGEQRPLVGRWPKACFGEAIPAGSRLGLSSSGISARVTHTRSAVGKVIKRNPKHSHVDFLAIFYYFFSLPCLVLSCLTNLSGYPQAFLSIFSATQTHTTSCLQVS